MSNKLSDVINIPVTESRKIGGRLVRKILSDAAKGIMQDGKRGIKYSTKGGKYSYRAAKARGMKKLDPRRGKIKGQARYFSVAGLSTDKNISNVNLRLTGRMLRSLVVNRSRTTKNQIVLTFVGEGGKVLANKSKGRDVQNLRSNNLKFARDEISRVHGKKIKQWARKPVNITVG